MLERITRKTMLYKTNVEYGDYTMNHVLGCSHGCLYPCYAMLLAKRFGNVKSYEEWIQPKIVENTLDLLDKEIPKLKQKIHSVQLSFTTDPFMYGYDEIKELSLKSIEKLNQARIKCTVLTKGLLPLELTNFSKRNEYGITLISLDEHFRERIEPNASPYSERIQSLYDVHKKDFKTWVSIEPYPTPNLINQNLEEILNEIKFVNKIIFGRTNYNKEITSYKGHKQFYNEQAQKVIDFCLKNNIQYHIKEGTITE